MCVCVFAVFRHLDLDEDFPRNSYYMDSSWCKSWFLPVEPHGAARSEERRDHSGPLGAEEEPPDQWLGIPDLLKFIGLRCF